MEATFMLLFSIALESESELESGEPFAALS
jgi:hypothetical protein